jgi:uncharacterized NAD(P)/FAD-binding protein YdhS
MTIPHRLAILGGGFCGVMVLWQLAHRMPRTGSLQVRLYTDPQGLAQGLAYGTPEPCHLLNVPAARMGALSDDPGHFHRWLMTHPAAWRELSPGYANLEVTPDTFMSRQVYGAYLWSLLQQACATMGAAVDIIPAPAVGLTAEGAVIGAEGSPWRADTVVLATGPMLAQPFPLPTQPGVLAAPWGGAVGAFWRWYDHTPWTSASRLALLGSGLTAVDMVLSLTQRRFPGQIIALSRQGEWPAPHDLTSCPIPWPASVRPRTAHDLQQALHVALDAAQTNWRGVIDGCRPVINEVWRGLPATEKALFLQTACSWWNVRRHRMPESSATTLMSLAAAGRLVTCATAVTGVQQSSADGSLTVQHSSQGQTEIKTGALPVDGVISTLGFSNDICKATAPLWQSVVQQGFVRPGPAGLGVAVTDDYVAFTDQHVRILTMGQSLFGERFETTAVPELRQQATEVASRIAG